MAIPNEQIMDTWFNLGQDHQILQSVSIMRAFDARIVQVGVVSNGKAWNSATNEMQTAEPLKLEGLDANLLRELQRLQAVGVDVEIREQKIFDGDEGTLIIFAMSMMHL